jgi:hypothetical protein
MRINSNINNYARINKNSDSITKKFKKREELQDSTNSVKLSASLSSLKEANDLMSQTMNLLLNSTISTDDLFSKVDGARVKNLLS